LPDLTKHSVSFTVLGVFCLEAVILVIYITNDNGYQLTGFELSICVDIRGGTDTMKKPKYRTFLEYIFSPIILYVYFTDYRM
jgi:hypothetical protein